MARKPITDMSAWPSLTLEGNLIAPAMVASIDRRQASDQAEEDYRIRKGLTIREEISTSFRVGQSHFDAFANLQNPSVEATRRVFRLAKVTPISGISASKNDPLSLRL